MLIKIHYSDAFQDAKNCVYNHEALAHSAEELEEYVRHDHVFFEFEGNCRSVGSFISSDVAVLDCDNDHSDSPDDWLTLRKLTEIFSEVRFAAYTSRSHNKQKGNRSPRPRFHVVFPVERVESPEEYVKLVKRIQGCLPLFDKNALDAARFYFGNKESRAYFHEGNICITEFLDEQEMFQASPDTRSVLGEVGDLLANRSEGSAFLFADGFYSNPFYNGAEKATPTPQSFCKQNASSPNVNIRGAF